VAALILEARAARVESERLRVQSLGLRFRSRERVRSAHERVARAEQETQLIEARRAMPLPSPWSTLEWATTDKALENTLVSLP
jgi:hypothetical protein